MTRITRTFGDVNVANELLPKLLKFSFSGVDLILDSVRLGGVWGLPAKGEFEFLDHLRVFGGGLQSELLESSGSL